MLEEPGLFDNALTLFEVIYTSFREDITRTMNFKTVNSEFSTDYTKVSIPSSYYI